MEDTRLIFLEVIKPFLNEESCKNVEINIDYIESRLAYEGYWGRYTKKLQEDIRILKEPIISQLEDVINNQD